MNDLFFDHNMSTIQNNELYLTLMLYSHSLNIAKKQNKKYLAV